jgi:release factor glutamine methyltransferase
MLPAINFKEAFKNFTEALKEVYDVDEANAIARIYFEDALNIKPSGIDNDRLLAPEIIKSIEEDLKKLIAHMPVQYVTGKTFFCGLLFIVNKNVLIPRPETEELVEWIVSDNKLNSPLIIDLCTGSGCIAVALKKKISMANVFATDISESALDVAKENALNNETEITFEISDVLNPATVDYLDNADIIVSNPPYISESENNGMDLNVIKYEPHVALFSIGDAFAFYKHISHLSRTKLKQGGKLFFEIHKDGGVAVKEIMMENGFENIVVKKDLSGNNRMTFGELKNKYF